MKSTALLSAVFLVAGIGAEARASSESMDIFKRDVEPFLKQHCYQCHDAEKARAGLRLDQLGTDFLAGRNADHWREVIDMINLGKMPPKSQPRPDPKASFAVVEWVGDQLKRAERQARMAGGRILMRRLNRQEYANTVGDLFQLDPNFVNKLKEELPADGKAEGFDRISSALFFDRTQLEKYLQITDLIAREVIQLSPPTPQKVVWEARRFRRGSKQKVPTYQGSKHLIPLGADFYAVRDNGIEVWTGGRPQKNQTWVRIPPGPGPELTRVVNRDGYYRIRIRGGAFQGERGEPIRLQLTYANNTPIESEHVIEVRGTLTEPGVSEIVVFLRAGQDGQKTGLSILWNGLHDVRLQNPEHARLELRRKQATGRVRQAVTSGQQKDIEAARKELAGIVKALETFTGPEWIPNENYDLSRVPRLLLDSIEVSGPVNKEWPPKSHQVLGIEEGLPESREAIQRMFARLLPKAYRRPVTPEEIGELADVVLEARNSHGMSPVDALRMGLQTMLCSPGFVFLQEPQPRGNSDGTRRLNDNELASRLSYFLWSSMPDETLLTLAGEKKLREPLVLRAQVSRMLTDPRAQRFVASFAGQWLSVDQFGSVMPGRQYSDYDEELEKASCEEPLAFFQHVLNKDLPVTSFLDSDFLVVNERLARHYSIEGVKGEAFRPVVIRPEHHRGGVLGMAGLLTLLADGNRTLPVRRAAWVLENLLNDPPAPPPPNAGEIQPNTAGKKLTVRERLALHRSEPTCASCHAKLDGYGLALENYDAIGAWRTKQNGENFRAAKAPAIDASGELKSGRAFKDLEGFKAALLEEKEQFARAFSEKMLTYALGRPVGYVDRKTIDQLSAALAKEDYHLQALIQAIVASEPFQSK